MAEFVLTNKAVEDLSNIWEYTANEWSEAQADRYYRMLLACCHDIANNPGLGRNYDGIAGNLLGIRCNRHIIFYRRLKDRPVEITRILHDMMDLKSRIAE